MPRTRTTPRRRTAEKIAISLPGELLRGVETLRKQTGESRSAVIRRAIEMLIARIEHEAMVSAYVDGYRADPETPEEVAEADAVADEVLAEERWE